MVAPGQLLPSATPPARLPTRGTTTVEVSSFEKTAPGLPNERVTYQIREDLQAVGRRFRSRCLSFLELVFDKTGAFGKTGRSKRRKRLACTNGSSAYGEKVQACFSTAGQASGGTRATARPAKSADFSTQHPKSPAPRLLRHWLKSSSGRIDKEWRKPEDICVASPTSLRQRCAVTTYSP